MLLHPTEMHIQFVKVLQQRSKRRAFRHLGKGVHVLGEALATIAELAIGPRHIGVRVVDVTREEDSRMHLAPVSAHLLAVLTAGIEIGDLISTKHVVHVLGQLGLQGGHDGEFLADKDLGEQLMCSCEHHGLLIEVLDMRALGKELRHIVYFVSRLA